MPQLTLLPAESGEPAVSQRRLRRARHPLGSPKRRIGPAFGGLLIAAAGSGIAFLLNAVSFFGVIYFLYRWKRKPAKVSVSTRRMMSTMFDGVRHMRGSQPVKAVLVRSAVFSISASALPASVSVT